MTSLLEDNVRALLPDDHQQAVLLGRIWTTDRTSGRAGPLVVRVTGDGLYDLSTISPTMAGILNRPDPCHAVETLSVSNEVATFEDVARNSLALEPDPLLPRFLAPVDLQPIKACGVTFHDSLLERVIEERAEGNKPLAAEIRSDLNNELGVDISDVNPGSTQALQLLTLLKEKKLWSQYLEVALGVDTEIFTKAAPMASVGSGSDIGILPHSKWNNPEPELGLLVNRRAEIIGATLGNDVNHRDIEGRSALLLGKAKDNNGGCALGPFIRLLDRHFTLADLRELEISLEIKGDTDNYFLEQKSSMKNIRRDIEIIVGQSIGPNNAFPDGLAIMLGAMSVPTDDRAENGGGFTHHVGDIVTITSPQLGTLVNRVQHTDKLDINYFGTADLLSWLSR